MNKARKSVSEKVAANTFRPDRDSPVAGFVAVEDGALLTVPPEVEQDSDALGFWNQAVETLAAAGTLASSDGLTISAAALVHSQWIRATRELMQVGPTYTATGESGALLHKRHPIAQVAMELGKERRMLMTALGLTPDSRHRVKQLAKPEIKDSATEEFLKLVGGKNRVVPFGEEAK